MTNIWKFFVHLGIFFCRIIMVDSTSSKELCDFLFYNALKRLAMIHFDLGLVSWNSKLFNMKIIGGSKTELFY
jgi:hypothetical protein